MTWPALRWPGGTLARQVAFIALGSVVVAHVIAAIVVVSVGPPERNHDAEPVGPVLRLLASATRDERAAILAAATRAGVSMRLLDVAPSPAQAPEAGDGAGAWIARDIAAASRLPTSSIVLLGDGPAAEVRAALPDGSVVVASLPRRVGFVHSRRWFWVGPIIVDLLVAGVPLALVSFWAARRVSGPLVRLAEAARHLHTVDNPAPLPEDGPGEVRELSRTLNALIDKLHRFVLDRTRMLAAISHDLRTPLTRLRLRLESVADEAVRERMLRDILRMEAMIGSTLAFIREDEMQERVEPVDIAVLAVTVCDAFADAGADVAYAGPLHWPADCRPLAIERALTNLVDNAVKFGGSAALTLLGTPRGVLIDVEDCGPGIADADKREVFKPFTRGDQARPLDQGGVGLGLTIARSIVQSHGGSIELNDRAPSGLRVRVHLPRAA